MRFVFVCVWFFLLSCCSLLAQAQREKKSEEKPEEQAPTLLKGKVVDQDDVPVVGANVKLTINTHIDSTNEWGVLLDDSVVTDEQGEFEVSIKKSPPKNSELHLGLYANSKIHFAQYFGFDDERLWQKDVDLGAIKISTGVRVIGQLVSPDSSIELEGPTISVSAYDPSDTFFYQYLNCDDEGRFVCVVPAGCKLNLSIGAKNFACSRSTHKIEAKGIGDGNEIPEIDLGKLQLKHGVSVVGTAKLKDGSPAKGIVIGIVEGVEIEGHDDAEHVSAAKTDSQGKFRLPPHLGRCTLFALEACRSRAVENGDTKMLESDGEVPFFDPVDIDLDGKRGELEVEMVEVGPITIAGTIRDSKGNPLAGQPVIYSWVSRFGVLNQKQTNTDADGQYSFLFGKGRKLEMRLYDREIINSGHEFFVTKQAVFTWGDLFKERSSRLIRDLEFNAIDVNVTGLDWEVRQTGPRGGPSLFDRAQEAAEWFLFGDP